MILHWCVIYHYKSYFEKTSIDLDVHELSINFFPMNSKPARVSLTTRNIKRHLTKFTCRTCLSEVENSKEWRTKKTLVCWTCRSTGETFACTKLENQVLRLTTLSSLNVHRFVAGLDCWPTSRDPCALRLSPQRPNWECKTSLRVLIVPDSTWMFRGSAERLHCLLDNLARLVVWIQILPKHINIVLSLLQSKKESRKLPRRDAVEVPPFEPPVLEISRHCFLAVIGVQASAANNIDGGIGIYSWIIAILARTWIWKVQSWNRIHFEGRKLGVESLNSKNINWYDLMILVVSKW